MLMPKKVKYRKQMRGRRNGKAWRGSDLAFGEYGLQSLERCWLDTKQIEAARVAVTRYMKRRGKVWLRIFPDKHVIRERSPQAMVAVDQNKLRLYSLHSTLDLRGSRVFTKIYRFYLVATVRRSVH